MEKNRILVNVGGKGYTLVSSDPPEYVERVAAYADRTLRETAVATRQSVSQAAVMTVISLSDQVLKSQDEISRLKKQLQTLQALRTPQDPKKD